MKKILSLLLLLPFLGFSQTLPITTVNNLKINSTVSGTNRDSALVIGSDKIVRNLPISTINKYSDNQDYKPLSYVDKLKAKNNTSYKYIKRVGSDQLLVSYVYGNKAITYSFRKTASSIYLWIEKIYVSPLNGSGEADIALATELTTNVQEFAIRYRISGTTDNDLWFPYHGAGASTNVTLINSYLDIDGIKYSDFTDLTLNQSYIFENIYLYQSVGSKYNVSDPSYQIVTDIVTAFDNDQLHFTNEYSINSDIDINRAYGSRLSVNASNGLTTDNGTNFISDSSNSTTPYGLKVYSAIIDNNDVYGVNEIDNLVTNINQLKSFSDSNNRVTVFNRNNGAQTLYWNLTPFLADDVFTSVESGQVFKSGNNIMYFPKVFTQNTSVASTIPLSDGLKRNIALANSISGKANLSGGNTFTGSQVLSDLTASTILAVNGSKIITSLSTGTYPSFSELSYVKGVTSAIQTQINNTVKLTGNQTITSGVKIFAESPRVPDAVNATEAVNLGQLQNGYVPLPGTEVGKPVTGDLEIENGVSLKWNNNVDDHRAKVISEDGTLSVLITNDVTGKQYVWNLTTESLQIGSNDTNFKGAVGSQVFDNDGTIPEQYLQTGSASIQTVTEGSNTGYATKYRADNPSNYADIGNNAIDLSRSTSASSSNGAYGTNAFATGTATLAGDFSTAMGDSTIASGNTSTAFGSATNATGQNSTAFGIATIASNLGATAFGQGGTASGYYSTAFGLGNTANSYAQTSLGYYATTGSGQTATSAVSTDRLLNIGNGTNSGSRSDALILLKNGLMTLPSVTNTLIDGDATGKAVITKEYIGAYGRAVNTTTVGLTKAQLNTAYPDVPIGYRVICHNITLGGAIYTKATEAGSSDVWLMTSAPVAP